MKEAILITIGDEILIGQILDTNSAWLASALNNNGIKVKRMLSVGDSKNEIRSALDAGISTADIVIITGGLGPTRDDITKTVLAEYFGCGMREDHNTYERIKTMLQSRGVEFNELNRSQAIVPECCRVVPNDNGTAPGMWFEKNGRIIISLPGVPFEMKSIMESHILPELQKISGKDRIIHRTLMTYGLPESMLAEKIAPWEDRLPGKIKLAYLPNPSGIRLRLSSYGADEGSQEDIDRAFEELQAIIPDHILGQEGESVESVTARLLVEKNATLAIAESCTGGYLSSRFTAMPGASKYFLGGIISYSNDMKTSLLGVKKDTLANYGAVSTQTAEEMALGAINATGASYALATTGIAGPDGGTPDKPVGTVCIAVSNGAQTITTIRYFGNLRQVNIERSAAAAIDMLRHFITEQEGQIV